MDSKANILSLLVFYAIILSACGTSEPSPTTVAARPTPSRPAIVATAASTATIQTASPTPSGPLAIYDDKSAPFSINYPTGWQIREEPETIHFNAPDQSATLQVILYEYLEPAPANVTAKIIFDRYAQNGGIKVTRPVTNTDGSASGEIEYTDAATRASAQGLLRVWLAKNRKHHFIVLFASVPNQWTRWKTPAQSVLDSFKER